MLVSAPIIIRNINRGSLTVGYTENLPYLEEFEQKLVNEYANRLSKIIERKETVEDLSISEKRFRENMKISLQRLLSFHVANTSV